MKCWIHTHNRQNISKTKDYLDGLHSHNTLIVRQDFSVHQLMHCLKSVVRRWGWSDGTLCETWLQAELSVHHPRTPDQSELHGKRKRPQPLEATTPPWQWIPLWGAKSVSMWMGEGCSPVRAFPPWTWVVCQTAPSPCPLCRPRDSGSASPCCQCLLIYHQTPQLKDSTTEININPNVIATIIS